MCIVGLWVSGKLTDHSHSTTPGTLVNERVVRYLGNVAEMDPSFVM